MDSIAHMSNMSQLGRVESSDTAIGSGIFRNPKYEVGDVTTREDFNLQLTKENYNYDASVNNDLTGNTMTSEASGAGAGRGSGIGVTTMFEDYLDLEAMQLQQQLQQQQQQLQLQMQVQQQQQQQLQQQAPQQKRFGPRRLSISDYDVDNAGYYEYEYFGKHAGDRDEANLNDGNNEVMNEVFTDLDFKLGVGQNLCNDDNFLQDDVVMMSDDEWDNKKDGNVLPMSTNNDLFALVPQTQELEMSTNEEHDFDIDAPLIGSQQPPKKKVRDYFKLNFFTSGNNNNDVNNNNDNNNNNNDFNNNNTNNNSGYNGNGNGNGNGTEIVFNDEPVFKKKSFWNRNPIKRRARQDESLHLEDHILVNPSQLITSSNELDDDDTHTVSEPLTRLGIFDHAEEKELPGAVIGSGGAPGTGDSRLGNVAPLGTLETSTTTTATTTTATAAAAATPTTTTTDNIDGSTIASSPPSSVPRKRLGSMPKTRGRKPSPIPDATKHFGCEYCDRRFKRQEHLKRHVRSLHMCEKPFGCHICGKKFSRSDNLNQHIKTHTHQ